MQTAQPFRIVLVTQDEPFYLGRALDYFINNIPKNSEISAAVVLGASPFGPEKSFASKIIQTWRIFGLQFFIRYTSKFVFRFLIRSYRVKNILRRRGIPILNIHNINAHDSIEKIQSYQPNIILSIQSNQLFKAPIISLPSHGCLNIHSALLPKYRGLMPTFWALKNGEKETGVSVFFIDEKIDNGPIIVQKKININERSLDRLIKLTKKVGMDACIKAIEKMMNGKYELMENDGKFKTQYPFPKRSDVKEFLRQGNKFF